MKKVVLIAGILVAFTMCLSTVEAADSVQIAQAIDDGMTWLAGVQDPGGYWGTGYQVAITGLCVKKFEHYATHSSPPINPLDPAYPYYNQVKKGLDYLFSRACIVSIGLTPNGDNPDSDGDGIGVHFNYTPCGSEDHSVYETGIALMAIVENNCADSVVDVSGSPIDGWTYNDVAVDVMDWLAHAQNDGGSERGGWGYNSNNVGWSDNSNTGYAVLGLAYASSPPPEGFSIPIPQFVKDELEIWTDNIQCNVFGPDNGGSGYESSCSWVNTLKTGNLLFEFSLIGQTLPDLDVQRAIDYLINHWNDANDDPGWQNHCQAMYCIMKGLEFQNIGTYLDPPANTIDWYDEFTDHIVAIQNGDGSWGPDSWAGYELATAWALLTLEKAAPPSPARIPTLTEWGMIIFCVLLFGWMAWVIVRRRKRVTIRA